MVLELRNAGRNSIIALSKPTYRFLLTCMAKPNSRITGVVVVFLLIGVLIMGYGWYAKNQSGQTASDPTTVIDSAAQTTAKRYILSGYPIEIVPLYQMTDISASKFFVNHDPANTDDYFGQPVNYYSVVFKTKATPEQTLAYYRSLMSSQNPESGYYFQVQGQIGKYKVSVLHDESNPDTVYLQVYLPSEEYQQANRYYTNYPNLGLVDETWANYESSYGLLNQKNGQVEYAQYFALPLDSDVLVNAYKTKKQHMPEFSYNEETGIMQWQEESNTVTLTFSKEHQRIYLMIRRPL